MEVVTDQFFHIVTYTQMKRVTKIEKKNVGQGRSECKLAAEYKKMAGFKCTRWLDKSGIHHQREACLFRWS